VDGAPSHSPIVFPLGLLALLMSFGLNYVLVGVPYSFQLGYSVRKTLARLRVGSVSDFGLAFMAGGSMGALLAIVYREAGNIVLPFFLVPVLLTRQALFRGQKLLELDQAYKDRGVALARMTDQIDRERTDERMLIAADLHDEVLQPLFTVSLLGQTLRNDLSTGRLLELEDDLPKLIVATEQASETIRSLVGDLRRSGLGRGGLTSAVRRLVAVLQEQTKTRLHASLDEVSPTPAIQLALYQVAKEALTNVLRHSRAANAWVDLTSDDQVLSLLIRDDGIGFDPGQLQDQHYGLLIMKERSASVGGSLYVDSAAGEGCAIRTVIPLMAAD
jgi:signal transduction histidine kinase